MRRVVIAIAAIGVTTLAACSASPRDPPPRRVRLAIHQDPIAFLPVRVPQILGYYRENGLEVDLSEVAGGTKAVQALLGGSVDVAAASLSDAMQLAVEGREVRHFLLLSTRPTAALAIAPDMTATIRSVRDLKGRTVGVSTPGSSTHQILNYLLVANGLSPDDVSTVAVGMSASSVAALEHGTVAAAVLLGSAIPVFARRHPDARLLVDLRTSDGAAEAFGADAFPGVGFVAEERWLRDNADTARRLARAITRGMQWVREHPPEEVRGLLPDSARTTMEADLEAIVQIQRVLSADGRILEESPPLIEKVLAVSNPKIREARVNRARLYTNEFVPAK